MNIEFKVHGVSRASANVPTEIDGESMTASVPCLEVELVTTNIRSGNLTLRLVGSQIEEGEKVFTKDKVVMAWFDGDEPKEEAPKAEEAKPAA